MLRKKSNTEFETLYSGPEISGDIFANLVDDVSRCLEERNARPLIEQEIENARRASTTDPKAKNREMEWRKNLLLLERYGWNRGLSLGVEAGVAPGPVSLDSRMMNTWPYGDGRKEIARDDLFPVEQKYKGYLTVDNGEDPKAPKIPPELIVRIAEKAFSKYPKLDCVNAGYSILELVPKDADNKGDATD